MVVVAVAVAASSGSRLEVFRNVAVRLSLGAAHLEVPYPASLAFVGVSSIGSLGCGDDLAALLLRLEPSSCGGFSVFRGHL